MTLFGVESVSAATPCLRFRPPVVPAVCVRDPNCARLDMGLQASYSAASDGHTIGGGLRAGYTLFVSEDIIVRPALGLSFAHQSFSMTDAGADFVVLNGGVDVAFNGPRVGPVHLVPFASTETTEGWGSAPGSIRSFTVLWDLSVGVLAGIEVTDWLELSCHVGVGADVLRFIQLRAGPARPPPASQWFSHPTVLVGGEVWLFGVGVGAMFLTPSLVDGGVGDGAGFIHIRFAV